MIPRRLLSSALTVVLTAVLLTVAGGAASAFFATRGSGTGTAGTMAVRPVTATLTPVGTLYPAGPALAVRLVLTNPNSRPVTLSSVTPGPVSVAGGVACTAAGSAVAFSALSGPWTVPGGGSTDVTLPGRVTMGAAAVSGCQGATFSAPVTVTGTVG